MIAPPDARTRILHSVIAQPHALAVAIASPEALAGAHILKDDRRATVLRMDHTLVGAVVVKTRLLNRFRDRLDTMLRRTQLERQIRGARTLQRIGVATAEPLLLLRGAHRATGTARESLVTRALPGRTLLHLMDDVARRRTQAPSLAAQRAVAHTLGRQLQRFAAAGLFNRDHKPSNLIVMFDDSPPEIGVIDTVAIRRDRVRDGGLRMLTSLMLEPLGCGCPPPRTMRMRTLIAATTDASHPHGAPLIARKAAWRAVAQAIYEHGDPTPRVNPLA